MLYSSQVLIDMFKLTVIAESCAPKSSNKLVRGVLNTQIEGNVLNTQIDRQCERLRASSVTVMLSDSLEEGGFTCDSPTTQSCLARFS